jgi:S1-C subfamily serine protease
MNEQREKYARDAEALPENDPRYKLAKKNEATMNIILRGILGAAPLGVGQRVLYGIEVMSLTPQLAKYLSVEQGVLVSEVASSGKAQQAGIKAGDVILNIGEQNVSSVETFVQALNDSKDEALEIQISRRGQRLKLKMTR